MRGSHFFLSSRCKGKQDTNHVISLLPLDLVLIGKTERAFLVSSIKYSSTKTLNIHSRLFNTIPK